ERVKTTADRAATLRAVGIASKNARLDACGQVRRIVRGHPRKRALPRTLRRHANSLRDAFVRKQLWIALPQDRQLLRDPKSVGSRQHFRRGFAFLRGIEADPDAHDFRSSVPEGNVFV